MRRPWVCVRRVRRARRLVAVRRCGRAYLSNYGPAARVGRVLFKGEQARGKWFPAHTFTNSLERRRRRAE